ncbi:unnamed protein product [Phytophthora fragariaefolia]|uniref:Unnamed protein product n=1 Tax=Phytophthora fragariaefolia TaxID=1490495 RepID=A0A9W6TQV3_9STRA|nr:unnamed protein product [Phytophthora fragariaefolia]
MGIVNAFIVNHWARQRRGDAPTDDAKFLEQLQMQLIQVSSDDFLDEMRGLGKKRRRRSSGDAEEENEDEAAEEAAAAAEGNAEGGARRKTTTWRKVSLRRRRSKPANSMERKVVWFAFNDVCLLRRRPVLIEKPPWFIAPTSR